MAPCSASRQDRRDRGQAAVTLLVAVTAIAVVLLVAIVRLGGLVLDRSAAQTAADAAALAGLTGGRPAAEELASANGGELIGWSIGARGADVVVTVRVGAATATARASDASPQLRGVVTGPSRPGCVHLSCEQDRARLGGARLVHRARGVVGRSGASVGGF